MRTLKFTLAAAVLLILAACGSNNSNTFPEAVITSVTPAEVAAGAELTVTGRNYYAVTGAGATRIEACGVTIDGSLVEPLTRTILLPPGSTITAEVGSTITGTLPEPGFSAGLSDVRVTRPDGSAAVLENAVTCVIPSEEPDPKPQPQPEPELPAAPSITNFTGPNSALVNETFTLTWEINNPSNSDLTCTLNPGGEADLITLEDCSAGELEITYATTGTFTAELNVTDEHDQTDSASHTVVVTEPEPVIPAGPVINEFTGPEAALVGDPVTFTWDVDYNGDELLCSFNPGDGSAIPELEACATANTQHTYLTASEFTAELTVTDEHGQTATATRTVAVTLPASPVITSFTGPEATHLGDHATLSWVVTNPDGSDLTCTLTPFDEAAPIDVSADCLNSSTNITFDSLGSFTAELTVTDEHGQTASATHTVVVVDAPPVITSFTTPETALASRAVPISWSVTYDGSDDLTCIITPGEHTPINVSSLCLDGHTQFIFPEAGPHTITFTVSDESGNTDTETITVQINNALAPQITTFEATSPVTHRDAVTFDWAVNNPQSDPLTCTFKPTADATPVALDDCLSGTIQHTYASVDEFEATFTVHDEHGNTVSETVDVIVEAPPAPVINLFDSHFPISNPPAVNDPVNLYWSISSHPDDASGLSCVIDFGDNDSYDVDCEDAAFDRSFDNPGAYTATITVTDAYGQTDTRTQDIVVVPAPPMVILDGPETALAGQEFNIIRYVIYDGDLDDLTCTYTPMEGAPTEDVSCDSGSYTHRYGTAGTLSITFTVSRDYGDPVTVTHEVEILEPVAPEITSFTGPAVVLVNETIPLTWAVDYDGSDDLTCTVTPSAGAAPVDVSADCITGSTSVSYDTAGLKTAILTVRDESGNEITDTHELQVNNALAPEITLFELTSPTVIGDDVSVFWKIDNPQGDPLTCSFHPGIEGAKAAEISDCTDMNGIFGGYPTAGDFTATLTVKDEHSNEVTATQIVHVDLPVAPSIESFAVQSPVMLRHRNEVTWEVNNPHGGPLTCTFTSGEEDSTPQVLTNCDDGTYSYEYANVGTYTATLTVQDEHNDAVTETATVQIDFPHPPTVTEFTTTATNDNPIRTGEEVTFDWVIADHVDELPHLLCELHFGDGTSESVTCADQQATHTYASPNNYAVSLLVTNQYGVTISANLTAYIKLIPPAPVIERWHAFLEYDDPNGEEVTVAFDVRGRDATGPVTCSIDFGDTTSPRELGDACVDDTRHTIRYSNYEIGGTYDATLTITDTHGNHVTETIEVNVTKPVRPVITNVTISDEPTVNQPITFTFDFTTDPRIDSDLITCTFNPGSNPVSSACSDSLSIDHTFTDHGKHTVTFTVSDAYNPPLTAQAELTVMAAPPAIDNFEGTPNPVEVGQTVTFRDWGRSYYALSELTCSIDPGDGSAPSTPESCSTYAPHEYIYSEVGPYTARLIVTDDYDRETVFTTSIEVTESSALDLTINTPNLPSGAEPTIYVYRGDPYFQEIINGAGTITVPGPGTYTIQAPSGTNHTVNVPYEGDTLTYYVNWDRIEFDFTVEAGAEKTVDLNFNIHTTNWRVATQNLPEGYDVTHPDVNARIQRLSETSGDWVDVGPITTTNGFPMAPGIYRVLLDNVTHQVCNGVCFTETYLAPTPIITTLTTSAHTLATFRAYELQTASLTATASGLPADLEPNFQLRQGTYPDYQTSPNLGMR